MSGSDVLGVTFNRNRCSFRFKDRLQARSIASILPLSPTSPSTLHEKWRFQSGWPEVSRDKLLARPLLAITLSPCICLQFLADEFALPAETGWDSIFFALVKRESQLNILDTRSPEITVDTYARPTANPLHIFGIEKRGEGFPIYQGDCYSLLSPLQIFFIAGSNFFSA